jgi:hypothetical protein
LTARRVMRTAGTGLFHDVTKVRGGRAYAGSLDRPSTSLVLGRRTRRFTSPSITK